MLEEGLNGNRCLICPDNLEPQHSASCGCTELNQSLFIKLIGAAVRAQRPARCHAGSYLTSPSVSSARILYLPSHQPPLTKPLTPVEIL